MKKKLIVVGIALGVVVAAGISMMVWKALTITDPYIFHDDWRSQDKSRGVSPNF